MKILHFAVPKSIDTFDLINDLKTFFGCFEQTEEIFQRRFLDTFDWRLYAENIILEVISSNSNSKLSLQSIKSFGDEIAVNIQSIPKFGCDLPAGYIRTRLEPIIEFRALLPQLDLRCTRINLSQHNKDAKTIARIQIEENHLSLTDGRIKSLGNQLTIVAIKGYSKPFDKARFFLETHFKIKPSRRTLLKRGLSALGRKPMDYTSKLDVQLDSRMRSDAAAKIILRHLFAAILSNQPGVIENLDSEFLHDYRVAIRRTRSALSQLKKIFPQQNLDKAMGDLSWLGKITGPARDLDVYLLKIDDYKKSLPISSRDDLEVMRDFLLAKHRIVYQELTEALSSKRYGNFIRCWKNFIESPLAEKPSEKNAMIPIHALANRRIWILYKKVLNDGRRITEESAAEKLHDLRKTCKKLRYLIEFFQHLHQRRQAKQAVKILKLLQENLGDFQDLEVQEQSIKQFSQEMMEAGGTPARTLLAMGVLVMELERKRQKTRNEFSERFELFESGQNQNLYKTLFSGKGFSTVQVS